MIRPVSDIPVDSDAGSRQSAAEILCPELFRPMYDLIGDIHGCADELVELLHKLDYSEESGVFRHANRRVIFCGDFIDRGPRIRDVIQICRSMCQQEAAMAVMGNHELNALTFHSPNPLIPGEFLRRHTEHNIRQHQATLTQLDERDLTDALSWFRTLPPSLELDGVRAVHACWDPTDLQVLNQVSTELGWMSDPFLVRAATRNDPVFRSIERTMKGPEMTLPNGLLVTDKEGTSRPTVRIRWFEMPEGRSCAAYALPSEQYAELHQLTVPDNVQPCPYPQHAPPVFIGHYWLRDRKPAPLTDNVACLDYSVAKDGLMTAYRFQGERTLCATRFVTVARKNPA